MISRFFIDRPIFASVLSILIIVGGASLTILAPHLPNILRSLRPLSRWQPAIPAQTRKYWQTRSPRLSSRKSTV